MTGRDCKKVVKNYAVLCRSLEVEERELEQMEKEYGKHQDQLEEQLGSMQAAYFVRVLEALDAVD